MIRLGRSLLNQPINNLVKQNKSVVDILSRNQSTLSKTLLNGRTPSFYQVRNKT